MGVKTEWEINLRREIKKQKRIEDQIYLDNYFKNLKKENDEILKKTIAELEKRLNILMRQT